MSKPAFPGLLGPDSPVEHSRLLLENLLRSHGVTPEEALLSSGDGVWSWLIPFPTDTRVVVSIFQAGGVGYLRVSSPLATLPPKGREALLARLLELNAEMVSAALATLGEEICVVSVRPLKDLDAGEAIDIIGRVYIYACQHGKELTERFGANPFVAPIGPQSPARRGRRAGGRP